VKGFDLSSTTPPLLVSYYYISVPLTFDEESLNFMSKYPDSHVKKRDVYFLSKSTSFEIPGRVWFLSPCFSALVGRYGVLQILPRAPAAPK